jgi:hypothetical protein
MSGPAVAQTPEPDLPLATPKPRADGRTAIEAAQHRVRVYLDSVPNMPKDVVVVPATGLVPWPTETLDQDVRAEVWSVLPRTAKGLGAPLMMFAVRTDTGEVFALYLRNLQKEPVYR